MRRRERTALDLYHTERYASHGEFLDVLVKEYGIDGLYIDDTALDRHSMQRARRILDADGKSVVP